MPWLEFGVANGVTLRELADHAPYIYGFDSFKGLPEDWLDSSGGVQEKKGKFACPPPQSPENCQLIVGLFQDTLPLFLHMERETVAPMEPKFGLVHIDCDLYSSTKFVLEQLEPYLGGTVIAFDEIRGFPAGEYHEGRAWNEFLAKSHYDAVLIGINIMPARSTSCPADEWDAHGGFDLTDEDSPEYDGTGLGDDDIDGYDDE